MVYQRFYSVLRQSANRILAGHSCVFCGLAAPTGNSCETCIEAIQRKGIHCYQCGENLTAQIHTQKCGACLKCPKNYHRLVAACHYNFPINRAISRFKFNRQLYLGKALTEQLTKTLQTAYSQDAWPELILPIPLHPKRLAERGFNQSSLIVQQLSKELPLDANQNLLTRVKNTPHQIGLKAIQRRKNLQNAFSVKTQLPNHIALIDDVVTTGTTINEATKVCLQNGAERVDIWCLAKT